LPLTWYKLALPPLRGKVNPGRGLRRNDGKITGRNCSKREGKGEISLNTSHLPKMGLRRNPIRAVFRKKKGFLKRELRKRLGHQTEKGQTQKPPPSV